MICPSCRHENTPGAEVCFTCRTVLTAVSQGTVLSARYEIVSLVGRGGMGAVYRAHDRLLDEDVAIKILRADMAGDPELAQRLRSEIKLARTVSHWNVCRVHEYGEDGTLSFISMELVQGMNLKERVRDRGPLPWDEAFAVCEQAAEGLEAIHRAGIVHRDLTTANLMIDGSGRVRVMDFGIAKRAATVGAGTPYVVGSPEYMSPEQARGRAVDARSDIYALGVVAFELFTGVLPFKGDTPVATLLMHLEAPPPLRGEAAQRLPPDMVPMLERVLAKDPAARPATAREMGELFRAARGAAGGTESAGPDAPPTPSTVRLPVGSVPVERASLRRGVAVALVVLGAFGLVVWLVPWASTPTSPAVSPAPTAPASAPPGSAAPLPLPAAESSPVSTLPAGRSPRPNPFAGGPPVTAAGVGASPTPIAVPSQPTTTPSPATPDSLPTPDPRPSADARFTGPASPAVTPPPPVPQPAWLRLAVKPWADVTVDGHSLGQTPLGRIELAPGRHEIVLTHPNYRPYHRWITVAAGETKALPVDLTQEGVLR